MTTTTTFDRNTTVVTSGALLGRAIFKGDEDTIAEQIANGVTFRNLMFSAAAAAAHLADGRHAQRQELVAEVNFRADVLGSTDKRRRTVKACKKAGMTGDELVALGFKPEHV